MKTVNRICQILAIVFGLASLVLFFTVFATVVSNGKNIDLVGAVLAFGGKATDSAGETVKMAKSADILFCMLLTAISFVLTAFSFKSKKLRYAAPATGIISAVYMLVIALSKAVAFVDKRPLTGVTKITYSPFVLITAIALFVFTAFALAYLLIDDYLEVKESGGNKLTIPKRIIRFFRDYKSEVKKIVWPGYKVVIKNTVIVLIMCLLIGVLIWLIDYGLGQLITLILGK